MSARVEQFEKTVASWPGVSVHPHRFLGREFRFGKAKIGHIHASGTLDIPFTRAMRDTLLAEGLAQEHRWVPDAGWVTFSLESESQLPHALWLMRLSYLRYALKQTADPEQLLSQERGQLGLTPPVISLLQQFVQRPPHSGTRSAL